MKKHLLTAIAVASISMVGVAQDTTKHNLKSVSVMVYTAAYSADYINYAGIKNRVASTDPQYYNQLDTANFNFFRGNRHGVQIELGMKKFPLLSPTSKPYRDVYLGILFGSGESGDAGSSESTTVKGDLTIINGTNISWDTIYRKSISFNENYQEAGLTIKTLYHTNDSRLFNLFAGYEIGAAYTLKSKMYHISQSSKYDVLVVDYGNSQPHTEYTESYHYNNRNSPRVTKTAASFNLYTNIPIGIAMNCKLKNWKNALSLSMQGNFGMRFRFSDKETYTSNIAGGALGLKYFF